MSAASTRCSARTEKYNCRSNDFATSASKKFVIVEVDNQQDVNLSQTTRAFSLVHVSDLHLNGDEERLDALRTLIKTLRSIHTSLCPRAFLLITGDITDAPTKVALDQAKSLFDFANSYFERIFFIPGNHDIKRLIGNFWRSSKFEKRFGVHAPMRIDDLGLLVVGFDSNKNDFARGAIAPSEFASLMRLGNRTGDADSDSSKEFRVALLHHHPLPFPRGEGHKLLGVVDEEPYLYLKHPASFLQSCLSWNIGLVLHGHKHIHGLARYSVPTSRPLIDSAVSYSRWETLYVLSSPSTSGINCEAGFNVVDFAFDTHAPHFEISRYARTGSNTGPFALIDANEPEGRIRIDLADTESDPAVSARRRLAALKLGPISESVLFPIIEGLFRRGAFRSPHATENSWGRFYHAVVLTRVVWDEGAVPRLSNDRQTAASAVVTLLSDYERFLAKDVLDLSDGTAVELKGRVTSANKERFLRDLPRLSEGRAQEHDARWNLHRKTLLSRLERALIDMSVRVQLVQEGIETP